MTSANPGGEPLVTGNDEALARLAGIADALLLHDRDIVARCDDSVLRLGAGGAPQFVRRARGYTPVPIKLPRSGPSVLATGAWLKNTICITRGDEAFLSPHIGDLDNAATCGALVEAVQHLCDVLDVRPQAVAHDLHPDFFSTRFALEFAAARGLPAHAGAASPRACRRGRGRARRRRVRCSASRSTASASATTAPPGAASCCAVDGATFRRLGHLATLAMPGGDAAAREPWRMAAAALHRIGRGAEIERRFAGRPAAPAVAAMLARELRSPPTSSMGRWFDAAAALLGVRETSAYEGQAPMLLEARAGGRSDAFDGEARRSRSRAARRQPRPDRAHRPPRRRGRRAPRRDALSPRDRRRARPLGRRGRGEHRPAHRGAGRRLLPERPAHRARGRAPRMHGASSSCRRSRRRRTTAASRSARPGSRSAQQTAGD